MGGGGKVCPGCISQNIRCWKLKLGRNTNTPFEPMVDSNLKHLTLKITFLLALASTKCCSEIHIWVTNKVSNLGQWEKVALFPSVDFIAINQLAREGSSQSLSPVIIPAMTTVVVQRRQNLLFSTSLEILSTLYSGSLRH